MTLDVKRGRKATTMQQKDRLERDGSNEGQNIRFFIKKYENYP